MPQLDLFSLGNQFFWGVIFFVIFYFLVSYYLIPSIFSIMFARAFYMNKLNDDSLKLISFCFVFTSISAIHYSEVITSVHTTLDSVYLNKFVYNVALSEHIELELNEIYDNNYFIDDEK
jgi:hypothetical protein